MTVDLSIFCAIMKNRFKGDNNGTLVVTMHETGATTKALISHRR